MPLAKCRVAFLLPDFSAGGSERVLLQLAAHLTPPYQPALIVLRDRGPLRSLVPDGMPVVDLGSDRLRTSVLGLRRALMEMKPQIVVSSMGYMNLMAAAVLRTLPLQTGLVLREANTPASTLAALPAWLPARMAYRLLYQRADLVLCNAEHVRSALTGLGVEAARIAHLPNPVNERAIRAQAEFTATGDSEPPHVIAVGRLVRQKGFDRLIDGIAAAQGVPFTVTIIGEGPERADLEQRVLHAELRQTIRLAGYSDSPWRSMAASAGLVMTSRWEGFPNVALEALACGRPVFALAEVPGLAELRERAGADWVRLYPDMAALLDGLGRHCATGAAMPRALGPSRLPHIYRDDAVCLEFRRQLDGIMRNRRDLFGPA